MESVIFQILFLIFFTIWHFAEKKKTKLDPDSFKVSSNLFWDADFLLFLLIAISIFMFIFFDTPTGDAVFQVIILLYTLAIYMRRRKNIIDDVDDIKMPATFWNSDALLFIAFALSALIIASSVFDIDIIADSSKITRVIDTFLGDWFLLFGLFCYVAFRKNSKRQIRFDSQHRFNPRKIWHGELSLEYIFCIGLTTVYCMSILFFMVLVKFMSIAHEAKLGSFVELFNSEFELYASTILFALPCLFFLFIGIVFVGIWRSAKTSERKWALIVIVKIITSSLMAAILFFMSILLFRANWF